MDCGDWRLKRNKRKQHRQKQELSTEVHPVQKPIVVDPKVHSEPIGYPHRRYFTHSLSKYGYSLFALIIFLCGVYGGAKFLQKDNFTTDVNLPFADKSTRKPLKVSQPEDFFPVAEFRKQAAILIGCHNQIHLIPEFFGEIANAVARKVPLFGVVSTETQALQGVRMIDELGLPPDSMRFLVIPSDSIWIRDYAPFIVRYDQEKAAMVDASYRSKNAPIKRLKDEFMCFELSRLLELPVRSIPLLLEGGNFISNGTGLLLTSSKTILMNEQGGFSHNQLISMFNEFLGVNGVYAVNPLIDEPNGHLDMFVTMLDKNLAVVAEMDPSIDSENSNLLNEAADIISSITTPSGPIEVRRIPMPSPTTQKAWGDWRSYTNVIMANGVLLMPSYSDVDPALENQAEQVYRSALPPDWEIKRINCDPLAGFRGQLHCLSYNIPNYVSIDRLIQESYPKQS
ncbi:MAG: agmatine deiminase family protein [Verrucomicrobiota bacterium]|nr:agmatine deiminase family protein [Verrucomicrobiota bacterium]